LRVLAGDIGGTKVDLGLFDGPALVEHQRYQSRDFTDLETICAGFLSAAGGATPAAAAFGIAGPIVGGRVQTTNLPWLIEQSSMARRLGCPVALVNDLESTAHGIPFLRPEEVVTLNAGAEVPRASRAILAAGTGLGEGYMVFDAKQDRYEPRASEGGHSDFAARTPEEIELQAKLTGKFGHVSVERVVSGMGIVEILEYLASTGRHRAPRELRDALSGRGPQGQVDAAAVIGRAAIERSHPICIETMRMFVSAYGAEAGNLALKVMALGGVYIGGGIAPKILPLMTAGLFMESFIDKGRFRALMLRMPVRLILNEHASLLGAAAVARGLAESR